MTDPTEIARVAAGPYSGLKIVTSAVIGDPYEDWSGVRSKGRARRRLKQGHSQRIVVRYRANGTVFHDRLSNTLMMHPDDRIRLDHILREKSGG